jgi:ribonuclease-3
MSSTNKKNLDRFEEIIEYEFSDKDLLRRALTHRSFVNEVNEPDIKHNERLEFLGDAVLELAVTRHLFENYPERPEGELTSFRAAVVRTESLAETAEELEFGEYIFMSKGEESTGGRSRPYILANTVEAIIGAIYLDSGYNECEKFIEKNLSTKLPEIIEKRLDIDAKSRLQEIAQEVHKYTPVYEIVKAEGPDHNRIFTVEAIVNDKRFGVGTGRSKQEAEQNAAEEALKKFSN